MIHAEYQRFLQTLDNETDSDGVRKIANLVLEHLDDLLPLTNQQGQRVKKMVALAQVNWQTINATIQPLLLNYVKDTCYISQLKSMSVGPFRGFARQEVFDLSSRLVLIYGPNGTGKSSFCEALEYGLLGNVSDADSKRFRDQKDYLKNAHVDRFAAPIITFVNKQGDEIQLEANETAYRFCFVEKNRIDSFSRIAAQTPAKQTELISTLFGMESFVEFVRNFTSEIDAKYIDLTGKKAVLLNEKRQGLTGAHQQIKTNNLELTIIGTDEQYLANQYREGVTFSEMVYELNGDEQRPGVIQNLELELQQPIATKSNLTSIALQNLRSSINPNITELTENRQKLTDASQLVSFIQLYDAVSKLQLSSTDKCPACLTPLNQVVVDPYSHANKELQNLQHLAELQKAGQEFEQNIKQSIFEVSQVLNTCLRYSPEKNPLSNYQVINNTQATEAWWNTLFKTLEDGITPWQHLELQVNQLEAADIKLVIDGHVRAEKQAQLKRLRDFSRQVTVLQTRRKTTEKAIEENQKLINEFDIENALLIANVVLEKTDVQNNKLIADSYKFFVSKLNVYSNSLPGRLVADLGESVVKLYNSFNRNDLPSELLAFIKLPLLQNQRLEIAFQDQPKQFFDALHVLSEGHIRCIGLAMLLAKNLKENCPLLIFDDPVNAIDDEHRESIRRTLFEDNYFSDKQILLTCHGEEFFKDIHNLLSAEDAKQSQSFTFLPRLDELHIRVDFKCFPRNYIVAAREHINRSEIREALAKSRQALETLAKDKVWKYVSKYGDGNLSLKLYSHSAPLGLRNLTEQLKCQIKKSDFSDQGKNKVYEPLETLLGLNGDSREWRYLNKGTHEEQDRAEFDRHTVQTIIDALEKIDAALA